MQNHIENTEQNSIVGKLVIKKYKNGNLVFESDPIYNKVVSSSGYGRNLLIRKLAGDNTYGIEIDSARLGSGTTSPADSDTDLQTVLVSGITITTKTVTNNVLNVDVFVADADLANNTYEEFGLFCTNRLFSRLIISPAYTKSTGEDTLFAYTLTITG